MEQPLNYLLQNDLAKVSGGEILYNQANTDITYDRAIFFFNKDGLLEAYAFSKKEDD